MFNKRYETNIKKYLESGNLEDLGPELQNLKIKDYSKILEMLLNLVMTEKEAPTPQVNVQVNNAGVGLSSENIRRTFLVA
jgi:hypothetical protein